jgi:hypothetical protein
VGRKEPNGCQCEGGDPNGAVRSEQADQTGAPTVGLASLSLATRDVGNTWYQMVTQEAGFSQRYGLICLLLPLLLD